MFAKILGALAFAGTVSIRVAILKYRLAGVVHTALEHAHISVWVKPG